MVEPEEIEVPDFQIPGIEQKFQHFLNATVRSNSFYQMNTRPLHFRNNHWVIVQNGYGCVGFAGCFLGYWFNFNELFDSGIWDRIGPGIQHVFDESINTESHPGLREFVEDGASEQSFYGGNYYVSRIGTIADYINDGSLRFVRRVGHSIFYDFKWDPGIFNDFNVLGIGGHHVILYIKRGEGGENDPPNENDSHNQIWRLAADFPRGGPTTWEEEERKIRIRICPINAYHNNHGGPTIQSITLSPDAEETNMTTINGWLRNKHVTLPMEIPRPPPHHWKQACSSIIAIWKLKDLRQDGRAPTIPGSSSPIPTNLPRRIENTAPGGVGNVPIPNLTNIRIMKQVDGSWEQVQGEIPVRSADNVKLIIESTGVDTGTPITIEIFDYHDNEKLPFGEGETQGISTEIVAELLNFIVPNPPNNQIYFLASIYDQELFIESDWIYYLGNP